MNDTITALSTPTGESAIALVRLSGGECRRLAMQAFGVSDIVARRANFGTYKDIGGNALDEAVFTLYKSPASYTGEDMLEISCHGNPYIARKIIDDLIARGARPAQAGEFTRRAFLNDKLDLSQAEAVALVIGARSASSLEAAQKQLAGELGRRIARFSDRLMDMCALVEAYIDFPEDDLPEEDKTALERTADDLTAQMQRLVETSKYSALVHEGINAVIAGAPNAGKSSLLNALVGDERAIVSPAAGTTRDFIVEKILAGKYAVNIVDTAGLRETDSEIEAKGIEMALGKFERSDIRLLVLDASDKMPELPEKVSDSLSPENTIIVLNKCDLPAADTAQFRSRFADFECAELSCTTHEGVAKLRETIERIIEKFHIRASADDILVSARHADALNRALVSLQAAREKIANGDAGELTASDLREALDALGEIVGKTDNEAILDRIFSKFCIGK